MTDSISETEITVVEHCIATPDGELFAAEWRPRRPQHGPALLLLHDSLGCVATWRDFPLLLSIATKRHVLAYDRLGFGRSDARSAPLTLDFMREEAEGFVPYLMAQLDLKHVIPLGHSVGGAMAVHCGVLLPHATVAIVTEAAQMFAERLTLESIAAAKRKYQSADALTRLAKYHGAKAEWVLRAWTDTWLHPEFSEWTMLDTLPRLTAPLLAIHGDQDEFGSLRHPQLIEQCSGGLVEVMIMPGTGHVAHRERPSVVIDRICRFIEGLPIDQ